MVTPERAQQVAFSVPVQTDVKQILVTRKDLGPLRSLEQLGGKKVVVNPLTTYYENLVKVNELLRKQGKPEILIEKADKSLIDEDLLEIVNAGILPATVTLTERANLWASVFPGITPQPKLVVGTEGDLAFAMRKNPQFKRLVDEFVKTHAVGTSFGNTLWRRNLQSDQWVKNPTTAAELKKCEETVDFLRSTHRNTGSTT